jgi:hypothetical protein
MKMDGKENNSQRKLSTGKRMALKDLKKIIASWLVLLTILSVSNPAFASSTNNYYQGSKVNADIYQEPATPTSTPELEKSTTSEPVEPTAAATDVPATETPEQVTPTLTNTAEPTLTNTPGQPTVTPIIPVEVPTSTIINTPEPPTVTITSSLVAPSPTITVTPRQTEGLSSQGSTQYYLSPTGSDSNNGLSAASPWLSPNHAINCGDTILAAPGTYSGSNFQNGKWGTVTCPAGNNVVWLKCASFDSCKINATENDGMHVSASYWGVQGWEVTNTNGSCFAASPASSSTTIHNIIFANNIANGCKNNGINSYPYRGSIGPSGVDYLAIIGNLVYNAAGGNSACYSGISIYEPRNFDTKSGTHIYIAQNISWANVDGASCPGNSDGEGIILDDWNGDQSGFSTVYSGQAVVENNLLMGNGSAGIEPYHNSAAPIFILNNTSYANYTDPKHAGSYNGEILISWSSKVTAKYNIVHATVATGGGSTYPLYAFYIGKGDGTDTVDYQWIYSKFGNNTGVNSSPGFSYGSHQTIGIDPNFANPSVPGAPSCNGTLHTLDCLRGTLQKFVPSVSDASGYGYQPVTSAYASNSYYPAWLCNTTLPSDIISNYCNSDYQTPVPPTSTYTPGAPTSTKTNTSVVPTATKTNTPVAPTATRTGTSVAPTSTKTNTPTAPTATRTNTLAASTATRTNTPTAPTATRTNTSAASTATRTSTSVAPTSTKTNTPAAPTATRTNTSAASTATRTSTLAALTATNTPLPPPNLKAPRNNGKVLTTRPTFQWSAVPGATGYSIQISMSSKFSSLTANTTVSTNTYTVTSNLSLSKTFYWRVKPNGSKLSTWSETFSFMSANPPAIPSLAKPTNGALLTDYKPRLDWHGVADNYQVQLANSNTFSANSLLLDKKVTSGTHYDLPSPLPANSNYYWRVRAFDASGQYSLWSTYFYFKAAMLPPVPLNPANNSSALTTRPTFDWDGVSGATGYTIQISTSSTFSSKLVSKAITGSIYHPTSDLPRKRLLYWRISATGSRPSPWSQVSKFTSADPPAVPTLISPSDKSSLSTYTPTFDWSDPANADHYQVQLATSSAFSDASIIFDKITTPSGFTPSSLLTANRTFYWRVRAFNVAKEYSLWSSVWQLGTKLSAPTLLIPADAGNVSSAMTFDWGDVSEAMSYVIQVSTSSTFSNYVVNTTVSNSTFTKSLSKGVRYYWRVNAKGTYSSPWSEVKNFFTQ